MNRTFSTSALSLSSHKELIRSSISSVARASFSFFLFFCSQMSPYNRGIVFLTEYFREGKWVSDESIVISWGQWLAEFHNQSFLYQKEQIPPPSPLMENYFASRPRWDEVHSRLLRRGLEVLTREEDEDARREFEELLQWVDTISHQHG